MLQGALANPEYAISVLALLWARSMVCITVCPLFGLSGMPRSLKLVIALIMAAWLFPVGGGLEVVSDAVPTRSQPEIVLLLLKDVVIGFFMGFVLAIPAWVAEGLGGAFDNQRGAMTGQTFNPLLNSPSTMASLLQFAAVIVLFQVGGMHWVFEFLALGARVWPPLSLLPVSDVVSSDIMIDLFNGLARGTMLYFAPLLAVMALMEVAMALISLYAPHLQAFQLSMPLKSLVGLLVLTLMLGIFFELWGPAVSSYLQSAVDEVAAPLGLQGRPR